MAGWRVWVGLWAGVGLTLLDLAAVLAAQPGSEQTPDAQLFDDQFRPLLVRHCVACHGGIKPKGKFRLDNLTTDFADAATRAHWTAVIERLKAGEMPPKGKPRPPVQEVSALTGWLAPRVAAADAAARAASGRVVLRRLNRVEYENTVRDLLGINANLKEQLPEDGSADGFDNAAAANHTSSFLAVHGAANDHHHAPPRFGEREHGASGRCRELERARVGGPVYRRRRAALPDMAAGKSPSHFR